MNEGIDRRKIREYLLGGLSEQEADSLEGEYFADASIFEQVEIVEDDLIEQYILGSLSQLDRTRFERYYQQNLQRSHKVQQYINLKSFVTEKTLNKITRAQLTYKNGMGALALRLMSLPTLKLAAAVVIAVVSSYMYLSARITVEQLQAKHIVLEQQIFELRKKERKYILHEQFILSMSRSLEREASSIRALEMMVNSYSSTRDSLLNVETVPLLIDRFPAQKGNIRDKNKKPRNKKIGEYGVSGTPIN